MKLILYSAHLYKIGGIETFCYNFCKRMNKFYDIELIYDNADVTQLERLSPYCMLTKLDKFGFYEADIVIYITAWGQRAEAQFESKSGIYAQMVHANYNWHKTSKVDNFIYVPMKKITHHICVGEASKEGLIKAYGDEYDLGKVIVIYNLLDDEINYQAVLKLITVSRIRKEKGFDRMLTLAKLFKENNIGYTWDIFGDLEATDYAILWKKEAEALGGFICHPAKFGLTSELINADYLVQLSDSEGFCYSIYEALQVKTPCLVTNFETVKDQIEDGKNGYIFNMDMTKIDIDKIAKKIPKNFEFKELGSEQAWLNFTGKPKEDPKNEHLTKQITATVINTYYDTQKNRQMLIGNTLTTTMDRYLFLKKNKLVK